MAARVVYFWKKTPFIRLLIPLAAGIIIQWHCQVSPVIWWIVSGFSLGFMISFFLISFFQRYKITWLNGISITALFISAGALLTWYNDIRHNSRWFQKLYSEKAAVIVSLDEPLVEKTRSFKANANVKYIIKDGRTIKVKGKIILYFKKDLPAAPSPKFRPTPEALADGGQRSEAGQASSLKQSLDYGTQIIFYEPLQEIKNPGNPGGFDYKQYCLFQGITHQVYLQPGEFDVLPGKEKSMTSSFLYAIREKVLLILRTNIPGEKELGLAEALLIGYKDDLDKTLVQSYSNTGVVHIIAISGLHLGLVYWLLVQLFRPLRRTKHTRLLQAILIISCLWLFSLLAGGQPSVLRSAVMFTCIVTGQLFARKTSVYNTLAFSAFILLCYDPYWLWDVGFQLSYSALLSIVIFMKPVYNWFFIKNKLLDLVWKLNAVTIAAQILTVPVSLFHFHQFPVYFLLTNFIAVPLSSLIVLGEILLCAVSFVPSVALFSGKILSWFILLMNSYVEKIESLKYSLWDGLQISVIQAVLFLAFITGMSFWLMEKRKQGLMIALVSMAGFVTIRSYSFLRADRQQKIIVYNIPQHPAIDFVDGRNYLFFGDPGLQSDDFVKNFHLRPSRILNRVSPASALQGLILYDKCAIYKTTRVLFVDTVISFSASATQYDIDLLIISKNPRLSIAGLAKVFTIKQVVFDGSVSSRKLPGWKKDCDSLRIPYYDVNEKGAFVMNLN